MRRVFSNRSVFGLTMGNMAVGTAAFSIVGVLPVIAEDLQIGEEKTSLIFSIYAAAYAIFSPISIALTGAMSRRAVAIAALAIVAGAAICSALAGNFLVLALARGIAAIGGGLFTPMAAAVAFAISKPEARGRNLAMVFFGLQLAQAIGVPIGVLLAEQFGWQAAFLLAALFAGVALLQLATSLPREITISVPSPRKMLRAMTNRRVLLAVMVMALHSGAMLVVMTFLVLLADLWGTHGGIALMMFGIGGITISLTAGSVIARIGAVTFRRMSIVAQVIILPLFSLPLTGMEPSPVLFNILIVLWALLCSGMMVGQQFLLLTRFPDEGEIALSLNGTANYLGMALGTALGAAVFGANGPGALGLCGAAVAAFALVLATLDDRGEQSNSTQP